MVLDCLADPITVNASEVAHVVAVSFEPAHHRTFGREAQNYAPRREPQKRVIFEPWSWPDTYGRKADHPTMGMGWAGRPRSTTDLRRRESLFG